MDWETKISAKLPCMDYPRSACSMTWFSLSGQVCFATGTWHRVLTLLLLGVVVLLVNMHSVIYGVRQQLKGVHHLNVSPLLLPDQSSDHWATQDIKNFSLCLLGFFVTENSRHSKHSIHLTDASTCVPCIGRPSCERMRIQWSDMLRMTRGCKATETLPVTPEAMTLGPTVVTWTHKEEVHEHNISDASAGLNYTFREE